MKSHRLAPLLIYALLTSAAQAEQTPAAVQIFQPEKSSASEIIRLPARTAPEQEAAIFSRATGIVAERRVDIGDTVKAGDILAVIDAPEVLRALERAQAGVAQAEAQAALARNVLQRATAMSKNRVISEEVLDERVASAKAREADLLAARAELNRYEELKKFQTIRAPFDGTISVRTIERGDHIEGDKPQAGGGLFHIVRLSSLRVEVDAPPAAALRLKPGQAATIEFRELPGEKFAATLARSSAVIDTRSGTMRVELSLPNSDGRVPAGLTGIASISTDPANAALEVPNNAIFVRNGKNYVAVLREGRVAHVAVELGKNLGQRVEVVAGLTPDDSVILSPNALLQEGSLVQPK